MYTTSKFPVIFIGITIFKVTILCTDGTYYLLTCHTRLNQDIGVHPSITDGVHRNENFVEIIPVFSTFSNFKKKKKNI